MKFVYKAKRGLDQVIEGIIEAQDQEEALNKLSAQNLFPTDIRQAEATQEKARPAKMKGGGKRISPKDTLIFAQELLTLLHAKVELLSSLKTIYEQTDNARLKEIISQIYEEAKEGKTFSETLELFPDAFSSLFVNLVKAGEATGRLDFAFEQITDYLSREQSLKTKIKVALAYPILLLTVGLVSIFVLISFVVPKLKPIFESSRQNLPALTKFILDLSDFSRKSWFWVAGLVVILAAAIYLRKGLVFFKRVARIIGMSIPLIRRLIDNKELVNFTRALSLLLSSGVVALKSLEISTRILENEKLKAELRRVYTEVAAGESLAKSMDTYTGLPKFFTKMIAVGEESGRLGEVLEEISHAYSQQVEADILLISSLLEPLLILGLGLILGTIVLSILLPTLQITQMVH